MALASVNVWTGVQKLLFHFHLPPLTFPTEGMCAECLKSCLTLFNPTDCSPPGSSALGPWDSPGKNTGVGSCALLQGIFPTQGLNPDLYLNTNLKMFLYVNNVNLTKHLSRIIILDRDLRSLVSFLAYLSSYSSAEYSFQ